MQGSSNGIVRFIPCQILDFLKEEEKSIKAH
jgi:hypothetical protein